MQSANTWKRWMPAAAAAVFAVGVAVAATQVDAAKKGDASVSILDGKAERSKTGKGDWQKLKVGSGVFENDYVRTAADSRMEVKLQDGSVIRLSAESKLRLRNIAVTKKKKERKVGVKLFFGKVWSKVSKAFGGGESEFKVETKNAVAGVRGTTFRINASSDGAALVRVYAGAVAVSNQPQLVALGGKKGKKAKNGRRLVGKPKQVTKKKYEELLAKAMQQVKVSSSGQMDFAEFKPEDDTKEDAWVAWNRELDDK